MKKIGYLLIVLVIAACGTKKERHEVSASQGAQNATKLLDDQTYLLKNKAADKSYAFTAENPVKVGGVKQNTGPKNERRFLNALLGPNGEKVSYIRSGSCCGFKTPNALIGDMAVLDAYRVCYVDSPDTVTIYINMYDADDLFIPVGFTAKNS